MTRNLPGEMQITLILKKVSVGTELNIVQEGVPGVIPAEACYLGWQESLRCPAHGRVRPYLRAFTPCHSTLGTADSNTPHRNVQELR
jgi:hypothetical protein